MGVKKGYFRTRAVLLLLFMAVLFWGCSSGETQPEIQEENKGFDTEEEAVLSYLAGLRDNDFGRMEDTFLDKSRAAEEFSPKRMLPEPEADGGGRSQRRKAPRGSPSG